MARIALLRGGNVIGSLRRTGESASGLVTGIAVFRCAEENSALMAIFTAGRSMCPGQWEAGEAVINLA